MKKFLLLLLCALSISSLFAQQAQEEDVELDPVTGFPVIKEKPFVRFNEGITYANVNRLIANKEKSNYVWTDHMIGAYFQLQTGNMKPYNSLINLSVYYPFSHGFNGVEQIPKQVVLYAFDLFAGPFIEADMWQYVMFKFGGGLHYMYQLTDEWHLHYLGLEAIACMELPVTHRITVLLDGMFSFDYPNFGTNSLMQPYDYSWAYHFNAGVRYSVNHKNKYSYKDSRRKPKKTIEE